jgi:hypothetical protein
MPFYSSDDARPLVIDAYRKYFGRDPDETEIAQGIPMFQSEWQGGEKGYASIAELAQREKQRQEELNRPKQEAEKRATDAKQYYEGIGGLIKSTLGRDPTTAEIEHFAKLKVDGFDDYDLQNALQTLPEYVEKQDATAREKLRGELSTADQAFFEKNIMPAIQSRFAQQGRSVDSSGYAAALANAAKDMGTERESYLAGLGRSDYENRRSLAVNTWLNNLQRNYSTQDYNTARANQVSDVYRQRNWDLQDYEAEKRAYDEYIRNYGRRKKSGLMGGVGALAGAGLGALLAVPTGGMSIGAGAMLGSTLGGAGGSMFDQY